MARIEGNRLGRQVAAGSSWGESRGVNTRPIFTPLGSRGPCCKTWRVETHQHLELLGAWGLTSGGPIVPGVCILTL